MRGMHKKYAALLSFLLFGAGAATAQLQFRPMNVDLAPQGRNSSTTFSVSNAGAQPIAVRLRLLTREVAEDGTETRRAVDKEYLSLFPTSAVVDPGEVRAVRVTWHGPAIIDRELAYRILAEQVPVDFSAPTLSDDKGQVNIDILFRYLGAIYVVPENAEPQIEARVERSDAPDRANVVIENVGTRHVVLRDLTLTLTGSRDGQSVVYEVDTDQLKNVSGANILAGMKRVHPVTLPADFPGGPISVYVGFTTQ